MWRGTSGNNIGYPNKLWDNPELMKCQNSGYRIEVLRGPTPEIWGSGGDKQKRLREGILRAREGTVRRDLHIVPTKTGNTTQVLICRCLRGTTNRSGGDCFVVVNHPGRTF